MTERERSDNLREKVLQEIMQHLATKGEMIDRILSQGSPNALLLSTLDSENNDRYVEIKFIVKKPEYEPDEDLEYYQFQVKERAIKKVKAAINKLPKKEQILAKANADELVKQELGKYSALKDKNKD
jgi:DNA-binding PucR family transcriptional regulator